MNRKILFLCGVLSPLVFTANVILGGGLLPGYNHVTDTISDLFTPGAPNKVLLVAGHWTYALLTILFGVGVLLFVRRDGSCRLSGTLAAWMILATGVINLFTVTVFPQDVRGTTLTFPGLIHIILVALLVLFAVLSAVLMAVWTKREGLFAGFWVYSLITVGALLCSGALAGAAMDGPYMGLTERFSSLICFQWNIVLALYMLRHSPNPLTAPSIEKPH